MKEKSKSGTLTATIALTMMIPVGGFAQGIIEEVVITATKRGETLLQETPLSITAFSSSDLDAMHMESIRDLGKNTPGLVVSNNASYAQLYIRGVGSNNVFIGSDPSVTVHIDGVYLARPLMVFTDFLDIERVEVLRGPQGTLYGRNSAGGTINIISRQPSNDLRMSLAGEYGNYDKRKLTGSVSGPLVDNRVMAGISILKNDRDGYVDNVNPDTTADKLNNEDSFAIRGMLKFIPSESVEVLISGDYFESEDYGNQKKPLHVDGFGNPVVIPIPGFSPTIISDPWTVSIPGDYPSYNDMTTKGVSGKLTAHLSPEVTLTSLTAYRKLDFKAIVDSDATDVAAIGPFNPADKQDQFSQELQLTGNTGSLEWLAGLYYFTEESDFLATAEAPFFGLIFSGFMTTDFLSVNDVTGKTDAYAAYVQGSYAVNEKLSLTAGIRYSHEKKSIDASASIFLDGFELPIGFTNQDKDSWDGWTPKFGLDYKVNDDVMLYASITRGFKSGGFNFSADQPSFDPEFLWAYEIGIKSDLADKRLRANASAFYYDYTDLQVQGFKDLSDSGGVAGVILTNAANATVKGFELEVTALPVPQFMLSASVAYLDATYDEFITARSAMPTVPVDVSGNVLNNSPKWAFNISAQYDVTLGDKGTLSFRAGYKWQDDVFFNSQFNDPLMGQKSFGLLDARIGYISPDKRWEVSVFGNNLTDKAYYTDMADYSPLGLIGHITPPRTYGIKLAYRYE
ncbi:MAG: TonB-dependent receptor [Sphingomonadales bacterium]|nr:TonB-dependent receptor [Sphingomonadales bacterium]